MSAEATAVADKLLGIDLTGYTGRLLNVSTAHIPYYTNDALTNGSVEGVSVKEFHSGEAWLVYLNVDQTPDPKHSDLAALIAFATQRGYDYLVLDADGDWLPAALGFATFAW